MRASMRTADEATVRLLDGLVVFWLVLWLLVGGWTGWSLWQLADLGDTVTSSGQALGSTGEALRTLGELPVVGEAPGQLGEEVLATAQDVAARGQEIRSRLRQLALALGLSMVLIPTTPVLGPYLPPRLERRREVRHLRRALAGDGMDATLERYLAERAVDHLPYASVRRLSDDPWRDIADGRAHDLARAELARMGVRAPASR